MSRRSHPARLAAAVVGVIMLLLVVLLNDLDLRDALLVGHSMGGMVLGRFLAQYGELAQRRVAGVAFVATSAAPASLGPIRGGLGGATQRAP